MKVLPPQTSDLKKNGALKMEAILCRASFQDYYDLYSVLKSGVNIHELVALVLERSDHKLKKKNLYAMITNGEAFAKDEQYKALRHVYDVTPYDIQEYIKQKLLENKNKETELP